MSKKEFFPPRPSTNPTIYAYELIGVAILLGFIENRSYFKSRMK